MSFPRAAWLLILTVVGGAISSHALPLPAQEPMAPPSADLSGEERVRQVLQEPALLEFVETPLRDVAEFLADAHNIAVQLNNNALDDAGLTADVSITRTIKGVSLQTALRLMLGDLGMTYRVDDGVLILTTMEDAANHPAVRVYPVAHLMPADANNAEELVQVVRTITHRRGAQAAPSITAYGPLLIVRATEADQSEVEKLLGRMTVGLTATLPKPPLPTGEPMGDQ